MSDINIVDNGTLTLIGRNLSQISDEIINQFSNKITILDLTDNNIGNLSNVNNLSKLTDLILDKNNITKLSSLQLPMLTSVTTLWLNNNNLDDLREVVEVIVNKLPNIQYLSMLRNPVCPDMYFSEHHGEADAYQRYRYFVIWKIPRLTHLDATHITEDERKLAMDKGAYMLPAVPDESQYNQMAETPEKTSTGPALKASNHRPSAFLARGKVRYDGTHSEGNRFIVNDDL